MCSVTGRSGLQRPGYNEQLERQILSDNHSLYFDVLVSNISYISVSTQLKDYSAQNTILYPHTQLKLLPSVTDDMHHDQ